MARFSIPRWTATPATQDSSPELHVFSDASAEGYGAVAYRRLAATSGEIHVAIVFAKAHVVPIKFADAGHHESIPRLELQAARLAAEIQAAIVRESEPYGRIVMWTDSECVIKQLRDRHTRFKMYFANRISKIQALTDIDWWRYVPSADNPADDCSRGLSSMDPKWERFHNGPAFLWRPEDEWPQKTVVAQLSPADILAVSIAPPPPIPSDHWALRVAATVSSWRRKLRRVAAVRAVALAMLERWRRRRRGEAAAAALSPPSLSDFDAAERLLLGAIQRRHFGDVFAAASGGGRGRRSSLAALNPFQDADGLLRCGGRLAKATHLSLDARSPIILPHDQQDVTDLVRHIHEDCMHAGVEQTLGASRRRFWIVKGRRVVGSVVRACVPC